MAKDTRGGKRSAGATGMTKDGALSTKTREIETTYFEARGYRSGRFKNEVLEASTDGKGNVTFSYASGGEYSKNAKTNVRNHVTFNLAAGAVDGETFGVNWNKVNSISGQTYNLRQVAKDAGLKWEGSSKRWVRK